MDNLDRFMGLPGIRRLPPTVQGGIVAAAVLLGPVLAVGGARDLTWHLTDHHKKVCAAMQNDGEFPIEGEFAPEPTAESVAERCAEEGIAVSEMQIRAALRRTLDDGKSIPASLLKDLFLSQVSNK